MVDIVSCFQTHNHLLPWSVHAPQHFFEISSCRVKTVSSGSIGQCSILKTGSGRTCPTPTCAPLDALPELESAFSTLSFPLVFISILYPLLHKNVKSSELTWFLCYFQTAFAALKPSVCPLVKLTQQRFPKRVHPPDGLPVRYSVFSSHP